MACFGAEHRVGVIAYFAFMLRCFLFLFIGSVMPFFAAAQSLPSDCRQLIVVQTDSWHKITATLTCYQRADERSEWVQAAQPYWVAIGKNGMAWDGRQPFSPKDKTAPIKKEGDGRSPAGIFPLLYAYGYDRPQPSWEFTYMRVNEQTLCIDDPQSRYYNQIISRDSIAKADWKSHEDMQRKDELYRLGIVIGYNTQPVQPGSGSCIFIHLSAGTPQNPKGTAGCTAMLREEMLQLLSWLKATHKPMLVQMPVAEWGAVKNSLNIR